MTAGIDLPPVGAQTQDLTLGIELPSYSLDPTVGITVDDSSLDRDALFAQKLRQIADTYSSAYGLPPEESINEPRSQATGFWESFNIAGELKNLRADVQNVTNMVTDEFGDPAGRKMNQSDQMMQELYRMEKEFPEQMETKEGQNFRTDIEKRINEALLQDPQGSMEMIKNIATFAYENPGEFADVILDETAYNPLLPVLTAMGYVYGGQAGAAMGRFTGFNRVLNRLSQGSARQRLAALTLERGIEAAGIAGAEGGIAGAYQASQNASVGRDPMFNLVSTSEVGAAMGASVGMLRGAWSVIRGGASKKAGIEAVSRREGYGSFNEMMDDLAIQSGWTPSEITKLFVQNMEELPLTDMVSKVMQNKKLDRIATETPMWKERKRRTFSEGDMDRISKQLYDEWDGTESLNNDWWGRIYKTTQKDTVVHPTSKGIAYNLKNIVKDFQEGMKTLQGLTARGLRGESAANKAKQAIFKTLDESAVNKWIKTQGTKGYAELLHRIEVNARKVQKGSASVEQIYAYAYRTAFEDMGADWAKLKNRNVAQKIWDAVPATATATAKTMGEIVKTPRNIYRGVKDIFTDSLRFVNEIKNGPAEGSAPYTKAHRNITNMLRDWEGNKLTSERQITRFSNWIREEIPDFQRRKALAHHLEGPYELQRYNAWRKKKGQHTIELTEQETKVGAAIRKYFDDIHDWNYRSKIFNKFRDQPHMFVRAQRLGTSRNSPINKKPTDNEIWDFVDDLSDPRSMLDKLNPKEAQSGFYKNYVPHLAKKEFAPTETMLEDWSVTDAHRAGQLQTRSRHEKKRSYETLMDGMDNGVDYYTRDIRDLVGIYGRSMVRAQNNYRLLHQLNKMTNPDGHPMIGPAGKTPDYYVEFKHPNFRDPTTGEFLRVNPNIAPDLRLYFDTNNPAVANRVLQNIIMISKRLALGFSFFHIAALGWSGIMSGQAAGSVLKNIFPTGRFSTRGLRALNGAVDGDTNYLTIGFRNGLGMSALEELKGDTLINGMRNLASFVDGIIGDNKYFKPLGKPLSTTIRGIATGQEILDNHLWNHVNSGLKATTYLTTIEKLIYEDAKRVQSGAQTELTDINVLAQRASQYTNDAYGNQNWNQMAMNVENFMGHRIAAAMNKPSMRGYIRMLIFAPDWSLSNARVAAKGLAAMFPGASKIFGKELASREYAKYALRSAVMFAFINEVLQQAAGQGSILDESGTDLMYANLGGGKKAQVSKQLSEVVSLGIHGLGHYLRNKVSAPLHSALESDSVGEFAETWLGRSMPIGVARTIEDPVGGLTGTVLGVPVYNDPKR